MKEHTQLNHNPEMPIMLRASTKFNVSAVFCEIRETVERRQENRKGNPTMTSRNVQSLYLSYALRSLINPVAPRALCHRMCHTMLFGTKQLSSQAVRSRRFL